ncbi:MAG: glycosyltransferase [Desulfamplus sp.]|nr:glycosyltransferase [Desulfamplus sp.]
MKNIGKTVVVSRWGCRDGAIPSYVEKISGECIQCPITFNACNDDHCQNRLDAEGKHADLILNHEPDLSENNQNAKFLPGMIDTDFWNPDIPIPDKYKININKEEVRILHAIGGNNRGNVKGTLQIKQTIEKLQEKGFNIQFDIVTGVSCNILRYQILQADIVIDQLIAGYFGSFARESMALGKPVISTLFPHRRSFFPDIPILTIEESPLTVILEELVRSPERRKIIGLECREYAKKNLSYQKLTSKLITMYQDIYEKKHSN